MTVNTTGVPSPITRWVRGLDGEFYLRKEVGDVLGVSVDTLKTWGERHAELGPTAYSYYGEVKVYLYTQADLERLRAHRDVHWPMRDNGLRTRKRGRPKLWTPEERRGRNSYRRRAIYLDHKADAAATIELAAEYTFQARMIRRELNEQYRRRFADVTSPRVATSELP